MEDAGRDDCLHASKDKPEAGLLNAPVVVARALRGDCAK
jgi:hypothetical protein